MRKILFVCMLNAARSQAAQAFFNSYKNEEWATPNAKEYVAESAGVMSRERLNPYMVEILNKKGISTEGQFSKKIDFEKLNNYDQVITFVPLPKEGLPEEIKKKITLWVIADPLGRPFEDTESIIEEIEKKIKELLKAI